MFAKKLGAALALATLAGLSVPAFAQENTPDEFLRMFKMASLDKNHDGMVSKQEFMAMMSKYYDMKAKAMGAKGGMLTEMQISELFRGLQTGG